MTAAIHRHIAEASPAVRELAKTIWNGTYSHEVKLDWVSIEAGLGHADLHAIRVLETARVIAAREHNAMPEARS